MVIDQDELDDLRAEVRASKRRHACQCGTDLPGTCPGPEHCPYSGYDEDDDEEGEEE